MGTLYPGLMRVEQQGLIKADWGVTGSNRQARFYSITARRAPAARRRKEGVGSNGVHDAGAVRGSGVTPSETYSSLREWTRRVQALESPREQRGLPWLSSSWLDVKLGLRLKGAVAHVYNWKRG